MKLSTITSGLLLIMQFAFPAEKQEYHFPLKVHNSSRYLVDQANQPFLYNADTAWMLFLKLSFEEAALYLDDRKAKGFTTVQVMLTGFLGQRNRAGSLPFDAGHDFSQPNGAYFVHVDNVIKKAKELNLLIAIAPLWAGCCGEGWAGKDKQGNSKPMNFNGPEKCKAFGAWLGNRYKKKKHLTFILTLITIRI
jgi:hypothetical protein